MFGFDILRGLRFVWVLSILFIVTGCIKTASSSDLAMMGMDRLSASELHQSLETNSDFRTQDARNTALAHALLLDDANLVSAALEQGANPNADLSGYAGESLERRARTIFTNDCPHFVNVSLLNQIINDEFCGVGCGIPVMAMARSAKAAQPVFDSGRLAVTDKNAPILMAAASYMADAELLAAYKERGADVNQPTYTGRQPIHMAARGANTKAIPWLLSNGASAHSPYSTPDHLRRKHNAQSFAIAYNDVTPLHALAEYYCPDPARRTKAIDQLIAAGAKPNATGSIFSRTEDYRDNWQDFTPLHAAYMTISLEDDEERRQRLQRVIRHLQAKGASNNNKLATGQTPTELARFLRERNEKITEAHHARHIAAQRERDAQRHQRSSSFNPSAVIAGAAAAGMAAYGVNKGGEVGAQAISTAGAMAADVASGGGTTHTQQQLNRAQQQQNTTDAAASPATATAATQQEARCVAAPKNCLTSRTRRDGGNMHVTLTNVSCGDVVSVRACARSTNPSFHKESHCWDTSMKRGESMTHTAPDAHPSGALWWELAAANADHWVSATAKAVDCRSEIGSWGQYPNW